MMYFFLALAAALSAQESPKEARVSAPGGELRYLYAVAGASNAPLLFLLPGSMDEPSLQKLFATPPGPKPSIPEALDFAAFRRMG